MECLHYKLHQGVVKQIASAFSFTQFLKLNEELWKSSNKIFFNNLRKYFIIDFFW